MIIYLYVKTHNRTGLKYLGKTIRTDPHQYSGSGKYWINHLTKHGYDYTTEILHECQSKEELKEWGMHYSNLWDVVNSNEWANLKPENGDGGDTSMCEAYLNAMANRDYTGPNHPRYNMPVTEETRKKMSLAKKGKKPTNFNIWSKKSTGTVWCHNPCTKEQARLPKSEVPSGFILGKLRFRCVCGKEIDSANFARYHADH